ncbi:hypothetical protein D6821_00705, partial [Candidatus Parcubacteria bacterium]
MLFSLWVKFKKIFRGLGRHSKLMAVLFSFCLLIYPHIVYGASVVDLIKRGVGTFILIVVGFAVGVINAAIGQLLILVVNVLTQVANYSHIADAKIIDTGWPIIRDLCNMFFILGLLIIAFATILQIESYNAKRLLPKLFLAAVLINFSRLIAKIIVDFAQTIMDIFVNGFAANGGAAIVSILTFKEMTMFDAITAPLTENATWQTTASIILSSIALIVTFVVMIVITLILVARIVFLWFYIILSPFAFLAAVFPASRGYAAQWWSGFIKQATIGPLLAFFIWLVLSTAGQSILDMQTINPLSSSEVVPPSGMISFF